MKAKQACIEEITQMEWEMFIAVNDAASHDPLKKDRPTCRDYPDEFRIHRSSKLTAWSTDTLESYLEDIKTADQQGRNLMTYKYARMDNLIPCENNSAFIEKIAAILVLWQKEFMEKYPRLMSGGRRLYGGQPGVDWASFENYLRCELETYSETTLGLLYDDIEEMKKMGTTMSEAVYSELVRQKGYDSLDSAENSF